MTIAIRPDLPFSVHLSSPENLSAEAARLAEIERLRVIHRVLQSEISAAALISRRWYIRIVADPSRASEAVLARLEAAARGFAAARQRRQVAAAADAVHLGGCFAAMFFASCQFFAIQPVAAQALLAGEERPAAVDWRRASHARQAAVYLVNQALAVAQKDLAALIGKTPAAVSLALRSVEDRRDDDPAFDAFCESALALVPATGGAS